MAKTQGETTYISNPMIALFEYHGWQCQRISGGLTQDGLADWWMYHKAYGSRWVEMKHFKNPRSNYLKYTPAQKKKFPKQYEAGVKLYCIADDNLLGIENKKKRETHYYRIVHGKPNIMKLFDDRTRGELRA